MLSVANHVLHHDVFFFSSNILPHKYRLARGGGGGFFSYPWRKILKYVSGCDICSVVVMRRPKKRWRSHLGIHCSEGLTGFYKRDPPSAHNAKGKTPETTFRVSRYPIGPSQARTWAPLRLWNILKGKRELVKNRHPNLESLEHCVDGSCRNSFGDDPYLYRAVAGTRASLCRKNMQGEEHISSNLFVVRNTIVYSIQTYL